MAIYLSSYYPICSTKQGENAIKKYNFPPYIDGSCRREPDFQNPHPCITGLCRPGFSKKLSKNDLVIYITNKKGVGVKKLVAILKVLECPILGHEEAAKWYLEENIVLPNNLMVEQTKPFPLDQTHQKGGWDSWVKETETLEEWDKGYQERSEKHNEVAICSIWEEHLYLNENKPIDISDKEMMDIFKRNTLTRNPPHLEDCEWEKFQKIVLSKCI